MLKTRRTIATALVLAVTAGVVASIGTSPTVARAADPPGWTLQFSEDFTAPLNPGNAPWVRETYSAPFDTITDDAGQWYRNDYGPAWTTAFNSFSTYRKEFRVGTNGWLTASLSARDFNNDGVIESPPSITNARPGSRDGRAAQRAREHRRRDLPADQPPARPLPHRVQAQDHRLRWQAQRHDQLQRPDQRLRGHGLQDPAPVGRGLPVAGLERQRVRAVLRVAERPRGRVRVQRLPLPVDRGLREPGPPQQPLLALPPQGADGRLLPAPGPGRHRDRGPRLQRGEQHVLQLPGRQLQHRQHVDQRYAELEPGPRWPAGQLPVVHDQLLRRRGRAAALLGGRAAARADAQRVLHVRHRAGRDRLRARGDRQLRPLRPAHHPPAPAVRGQQRADLALQHDRRRVQRPVQRQRWCRTTPTARPPGRTSGRPARRTRTTSSSATSTPTSTRAVRPSTTSSSTCPRRRRRPGTWR